MRKRLVAFFVFIGGAYYFLAFALPARMSFTDNPASFWHSLVFTRYHEQISTAISLVGTMALGLGIINMLLSHGRKLVLMRKGWVNSAALIAAMTLTMAASFWSWRNGAARAAGEGSAITALGHAMENIYTKVIMGPTGFYTSLSASMFSLLAFYIAGAAYRAFRLKSREAGLLMLSALIVMLGQIPVTVALLDPLCARLGIAGGISGIRLWLLSYVSTPAFRGIAIGAGIAGLAMATRMWLSLETGAFYSDKE